jgi:hypothetical protein
MIVDATESAIERPKKNKKRYKWQEKATYDKKSNNN